ncbi:MAG: hypothetical protein CO143_00950 [Candidatus Moranbacteria bacterium CG_4_9_14_3_um_filter_45_14]|nr:MAG: hypothetical protein CO143_00950 [Candidatus Moranbacteria bacterium CG_4_9_14_3_um_filter_45_14]
MKIFRVWYNKRMIILKSDKYQKYFFLVTLLCGSMFFVAWAHADITDLSKDQQKILDKKQNQVDAINAKIKAYNQIISLKQRQGSTLADQITSLQAQADKLELEISTNKEKITTLEGDISSLTSRIAEKKILVNRQKQMLSELMRIYYSNYSDGKVALVFSSAETLSFLNQENGTIEIGDKISDLLDSVKTLKESLVEERISLEEKKKEADDIHTKLTAQGDYLDSTKANKAYLLTKTQAEATKYDNLVDDLRKQQEALESEIADIEAGKIDQLVGLPSGNGQLAYPVANPRITQGYGKTNFSKTAYKSGMHNGIDFGGASGTTIRAAADGKVIGTGDLGRYAYGKWIAIDHGNGLVTLYGHLRKINVSSGKSVDKGDKIGEMGSTGFSTGTHLHFTVYASKSYEVVPFTSAKGKRGPVGASVNPGKYLK